MRTKLKLAFLFSYLFVLMLASLWPTPVQGGVVWYFTSMILNFTQSIEWLSWIKYNQLEAIANLSLYLPLGVFLVLFIRRMPLWLLLSIPLLVSVVAEGAQRFLLPERYSTLADIFYNAIGGAAGVLLATLLLRRKNGGTGSQPEVKVLFVCTGNTCRSPMAEQMFRQLAQKADLAVQVSSAGVSAKSGETMNSKAIEAIKSLGYQTKSHRAKALTKRIVEQADLVITMTKSQSESVQRISPTASRYTYSLGEISNLAADLLGPAETTVKASKNPSGSRIEQLAHLRDAQTNSKQFLDVDDPFGKSPEVYRESAKQIESGLKNLVGWLA